MTDDRRNKLAAIVADSDQYNAEHRDWLHAATDKDLRAMQDSCRVMSQLAAANNLPALAGMVSLAYHALVAEYQRRAELEVGGGE